MTERKNRNSRRSSSGSVASILGYDGPMTDWTSIYIASVFSFIGSVQFNIFFSSLWPYLTINDPTASQTFYGFIVASYSLGQFISSPLIGLWSNHIKQIKFPIQVGLSFMLIGNFIHIILIYFPPHTRKWVMMVGRILTGIGSSNTVLLKAYATSASTLKDRSRSIAFITGSMAVGGTIGPVFQACFSGIAYPGYHIIGDNYFNLYTAPAYLAVLMNIGGMIVLHYYFHESYAGIVDEDAVSESGEKRVKLPKYDMLAVVLMNLTRFTQMFVQTNLETIATSFSMIMFAWTAQEAVQYGSITQGALGFFSFIIYFTYIFFKLNRYMKFRVALQGSMVALFGFHILTYSWPFLSGSIKTYTTAQQNATKTELVGCNVDKYQWCSETQPINVWIWVISYPILIGCGFSAINLSMNTLYSKIIGPRRQGLMQGVMQMSGGVSRMIGPASMGAIYHHTGPRWAWNLEFIVIAANILLLAIFHKRLIPLQIPNESASIINATSEEESSGDEEEDLMSIDIEIRGAGEESDKLHETQGSQVAV